jgi:hypothetical protein
MERAVPNVPIVQTLRAVQIDYRIHNDEGLSRFLDYRKIKMNAEVIVDDMLLARV